MKTLKENALGYALFMVIPTIIVLMVWIGIKFDLAGDAYDEEGNPNIEVHQQYGSR